jgi:hypothetical protein
MDKKVDQTSREISIVEILKQAKICDTPDIYANHAQFVVTPSEIIIDLFKLAPDTKSKIGVNAERIQRIILPHSIGKGFVEGLANAINNYQQEAGVELVNTRSNEPNDQIRVFK